jgi:hypothetical protein
MGGHVPRPLLQTVGRLGFNSANHPLRADGLGTREQRVPISPTATSPQWWM